MTKLATHSSLICLNLFGAVGVMGAYAICWQQVLKRIEFSISAYMFKGTSLIFVMLLAFAIFGKTITWRKAGAIIIIITGVILFFL